MINNIREGFKNHYKSQPLMFSSPGRGNLIGRPHRRYKPLTGEWVLVSPHRTKHPWQGQTEDKNSDRRPEYDPKCYLCPGNKRASAPVNKNYESTSVFTNDFSALLQDTPG